MRALKETQDRIGPFGRGWRENNHGGPKDVIFPLAASHPSVHTRFFRGGSKEMRRFTLAVKIFFFFISLYFIRVHTSIVSSTGDSHARWPDVQNFRDILKRRFFSEVDSLERFSDIYSNFRDMRTFARLWSVLRFSRQGRFIQIMRDDMKTWKNVRARSSHHISAKDKASPDTVNNSWLTQFRSGPNYEQNSIRNSLESVGTTTYSVIAHVLYSSRCVV